MRVDLSELQNAAYGRGLDRSFNRFPVALFLILILAMQVIIANEVFDESQAEPINNMIHVAEWSFGFYELTTTLIWIWVFTPLIAVVLQGIADSIRNTQENAVGDRGVAVIDQWFIVTGVVLLAALTILGELWAVLA